MNYPTLCIDAQTLRLKVFGQDAQPNDIMIIGQQHIPHSENPNAAVMIAAIAGMPFPQIVSIAPILGGEDVTIDHNRTFYRCGCGAPGCNVPAN